MARDLNLGPAEVDQRMAQESTAAEVQVDVQRAVGTDFAGAWFDAESGSLTVAVTDDAGAAEVRAAGATPKVVTHSETQLQDIQGAVDDAAAGLAGVAGTHVDVNTNSVVITVLEGSDTDVRQPLADAGIDGEAVRVEETGSMPATDIDYRGGDGYTTESNSGCSMGFAVRGNFLDNVGFLTAGHCVDRTGGTIFNRDGEAAGKFDSVSYPGDDWAVASTNGNLNPLPEVNTFGQGGLVFVEGSRVAPIGASVCMSGVTSGWQCGEVEAYNATVNYTSGNTVGGLTATSACNDKGDSGGPYITPGDGQAQGVVSGSSNGESCDPDETAWFQPINEALAGSDLTLVTAS